jgi:hypothetical protein
MAIVAHIWRTGCTWLPPSCQRCHQCMTAGVASRRLANSHSEHRPNSFSTRCVSFVPKAEDVGGKIIDLDAAQMQILHPVVRPLEKVSQ